jgi:uncharacterized protein with von Willebrand factor type A (vWA) domain
MQKNNAEANKDTKETIGAKNSIDKNMEILKERLSQTKT